MRHQGLELWRPYWPDVYKGSAAYQSCMPDVAGELLTVTRESLRLALNALRAQNAEDYYNNYGTAEREIAKVLENR